MENTAARKIYLALCAFLVCLATFLLLLFKTDVFFEHHAWPADSVGVQPVDRTGSAPEALASGIEKIVSDGMTKGRLPGLSLAVVRDGETLYMAGFGVADPETGTPATSGTLYELASDSKAFTALGILRLRQDGLISLDDSIVSYLPWLKFTYQGAEANVTVGELLHHTSGIPSRTIALIPEISDESGGALEKTVRAVAGLALDSRPGERYAYATINYDILGLLIEKVSGMRYEAYIQKFVLEPTGLNHTYMYRSQAAARGLAAGCKPGFLSPMPYAAPAYEGNKPAGYVISNADDMALWLELQLGNGPTTPGKELVEASHIPDRSVPEFAGGMAYAAGWIVSGSGKGTEIFHSGSNPNYASFIIFRPGDNVGVAVLCNMNSSYAARIAQSVLALVTGQASQQPDGKDFYQNVDLICVFFLLAAAFAVLICLEALMRALRLRAGESRRLADGAKRRPAKIAAVTAPFLAAGGILLGLPRLAFGGLTWRYIFVWYPVTVEVTLFTAFLLLGLVYLNILLRVLYRRPRVRVRS